jgi:hypothetical protein
MWRILVPILLCAIPLAPASAVVTINAPARGQPVERSARPAPATSLSFGEMAAAVGGLMIFAVALGSRRRSVSA